MLFYLLHPAMRYLRAGTEEHPVVPLHEPPHDTNEGGEFLDDAIHMDEVPVIQTEENIAPGSPENFCNPSTLAVHEDARLHCPGAST